LPHRRTQTFSYYTGLSTFYIKEKGKKARTNKIKQILYNNKYNTDVRKINRTINEKEHKKGNKNKDGQNAHMLGTYKFNY